MIKFLGMIALAALWAAGASAQSGTQQCVSTAIAGGSSDALTVEQLPCGYTTNLLVLSAQTSNTTTTPTLSMGGGAAQIIVKENNLPLAVGDIAGAGFRALLSPTGLNWVLLNPGTASGGGGGTPGGGTNSVQYNNAGTFGGLGLGTSGQALISNGAGLAPSFQDLSGGGTVNSGTAGQLGWYASSSSTISGNANVTASSGALTLGQTGSALGSLLLSGNTSGKVSLKPAAAAGTYNFNLPITAGTSGQVLTSAGGGSSAMTWSAQVTGGYGENVTASPYNADNTCMADASTAINTALATGNTVYLPRGCYLVLSDLVMSTPSQIMYGDGPGCYSVTSGNTCPTGSTPSGTILYVNAAGGFTSGVIKFTSGEPGPQLQDFTITFLQPNTAVRGSLTAYPPAIYAHATPRFKLLHMRITEAMIGVDTTGNSGGFLIDDLACAAFTECLLIDGSMDTLRVNNLHVWPFDLTSNQSSIFYNASTYGILSGRADDLEVSNGLFLVGTGIKFFYGTRGGSPTETGATFGTISNTAFDTYNGIVAVGNGSGTGFTGPNIAISSSYSSLANSSVQSINATAGVFQLAGFNVQQGNSGTNPVIFLSDSTGVLQFNWSSGFSNNAGADVTVVDVQGDSSSVVNLENINFFKAPNVAYTRPVVHKESGPRLLAHGLYLTDKGTGAGTFITVDADAWDNVTGNTAPGWSMSFPSPTDGIYTCNNYGSITLTCGSGGGSGTVNSGTSGQLSYYASSGTAVSTTPNFGYSVVGGATTIGIGAAGSSNGVINLAGATSGVTGFTVPASAGSYTFTLPNSAGTSGYVLQTNGAGSTSWTPQTGSGTVNAGTTNQFAYYPSGAASVSPSNSGLTLGPINVIAAAAGLYRADGTTPIAGDNGSTTYIGNSGHGISMQNNIVPGTDNAFSDGSGGQRWTSIFATSGTVSTSDLREKKVHGGESLGLEFIKKLHPIEYNFLSDKAGIEHRHGFGAQEIEEALAGRSFAGLDRPSVSSPRYGLNYSDLIAPLVKSVQELSGEVDKLKKEKVRAK